MLPTLPWRSMQAKQNSKKYIGLDDKRAAVDLLVQGKLRVRNACKLVSLPRSAMSYNEEQRDDSALIHALTQLVHKKPSIFLEF
jgi:hypothetical protein